MPYMRTPCTKCDGTGKSKRRAAAGSPAAARHGYFASCGECLGFGYLDIRQNAVAKLPNPPKIEPNPEPLD